MWRRRVVLAIVLSLAACGSRAGKPEKEDEPDSLVQKRDDLTWVSAAGSSVGEGVVVYLSRGGVTLEGHEVASIQDGHLLSHQITGLLVGQLYDQLEEAVDRYGPRGTRAGQYWHGRVIIVADAGTPATTLVSVLFTADKAGFEHVTLGVSKDGRNMGVIPVLLDSDPKPVPFAMKMVFGDERIALSADTREGTHELDVSVTDFAAITVFAARAHDEWASTLLVDFPRRPADTAQLGGLSAQKLAAAIAAARGPGCADDPEKCSMTSIRILR